MTVCSFTKRKIFYLTIFLKHFEYEFTEKHFSQGYLWIIDQKKYRKTLPLIICSALAYYDTTIVVVRLLNVSDIFLYLLNRILFASDLNRVGNLFVLMYQSSACRLQVGQEPQ